MRRAGRRHTAMRPRPVTSDADIARCYRVLSALRPHVPEGGFVARVRDMMRDGYRLACIEVDGEVRAVAGYRVSTNLHLGKHLYVDDLVTLDAARSQGLGAVLLEWLEGAAAKAGCAAVHLDSGVQRERAHRFYFRQGYTIAAYHFIRRRNAV